MSEIPSPVATIDADGQALASDAPRVRMCPECRVGKHHNCVGFAFDADDNEVPCPCLTCHPAPPVRCTSCGRPVNPETAECGGCSD